jgi:hypothetical protein
MSVEIEAIIVLGIFGGFMFALIMILKDEQK